MYPAEFHDEIENNNGNRDTLRPRREAAMMADLKRKFFLLKNLIYIESCVITVRRVELSQLGGVLKNADMAHAYLRHVISF